MVKCWFSATPAHRWPPPRYDDAAEAIVRRSTPEREPTTGSHATRLTGAVAAGGLTGDRHPFAHSKYL